MANRPDITGGMGGEGVDAVAKFLDAGGTLIAMGNAVRFATEQGFARTVDASASTSRDFYAPRPLVNAEVLHPEHPVFYGYAGSDDADQVSERATADRRRARSGRRPGALRRRGRRRA